MALSSKIKKLRKNYSNKAFLSKTHVAYIPQSAVGRINAFENTLLHRCVQYDGLATGAFSTCQIILIFNKQRTLGSLIHFDVQNDVSVIERELDEWIGCDPIVYLFNNKCAAEFQSVITEKLASLHIKCTHNELETADQFVIVQKINGKLSILIKSYKDMFAAIDCVSNINVLHHICELEFKYLRILEGKLQCAQILRTKNRIPIVIFDNRSFICKEIIYHEFRDTLQFLSQINIKNTVKDIYSFSENLAKKAWTGDVDPVLKESVIRSCIAFPIQLYLNEWDLFKCWKINAISMIVSIKKKEILQNIDINTIYRIINCIEKFIESLAISNDQLLCANVGSLHQLQRIEFEQNLPRNAIVMYIDMGFSVNASCIQPLFYAKNCERELRKYNEFQKELMTKKQYEKVISCFLDNKELIEMCCTHIAVDNLVLEIIYRTLFCGFQLIKRYHKELCMHMIKCDILEVCRYSISLLFINYEKETDLMDDLMLFVVLSL